MFAAIAKVPSDRYHEVHMRDHSGHSMRGSYKELTIEIVIDFVIMYFVMYTMIASLDHFYTNINNLYMTLMMLAPMAAVMLVAMRSMFPSRRLNAAIGLGVVVVFIASYIGMRTQAAVGNEQFLRSMIPHHSGAILMCEQSAITDLEISALCDQIIESQKAEITQMQTILARY
jgi:uncharacterized protein (DUF305 family)